MLKRLPGLLLTFFLALLAYQIETLPFWPFTIGSPAIHPLDKVLLAIFLGMLFRLLFSYHDYWKKGAQFTTKQLLPLAIVLMGARLDFTAFFAISWNVLIINLICVPLSFFLTLYLCQKIKVGQKISILISLGTAICGGSAIIAAAPVIDADEGETSLSVTTITLYGVLAIFLFPFLGNLFVMNEINFGIWTGNAIQALPQVLAAAFAFSDTAGEIGLLVKLARILLLAPFVLGLSLWFQKKKEKNSNLSYKNSWTTYLPPFLIGFICIIILSSFGLIKDLTIYSFSFPTKTILTKLSSFFITMTMVAIGLASDLKGAFKTQLKILLVGLLSSVLIWTLSYFMIQIVMN